jgi:hypothetical protein
MENLFDFSPYAPKDGHVLVLKSLNAKLIAAHNDFQWPEFGICEAPDWLQTNECGNGLHGWLWGAGDSNLRCSDDDAKWLVLHVEESTIINLDGKVKFPKCEVIFVGTREDAVSIIQNYAPAGTAIMFSTLTGGYASTLTGGYASTLTGGYASTLTGGYASTLTGGLWGVLVFRFYNEKSNEYEQRCALIDGVNYLPGMKYKLNDEYGIEMVNDTEA